jgi:hypothetical protein
VSFVGNWWAVDVEVCGYKRGDGWVPGRSCLAPMTGSGRWTFPPDLARICPKGTLAWPTETGGAKSRAVLFRIGMGTGPCRAYRAIIRM